MADKITQAHRVMAIKTPLGEDKLLFLSMHGTESLGELFEYEIDLASEGSPIDFKKILGQVVTIRMNCPNSKVRHFNGYISSFSFVAMEESKKDAKRIYYYRATMVPWLWFLTRHADCKIFQEMKVPAIIEKVFRDRGFTDFKSKLTDGNYRVWEYCVQYRETDFNFVSRLMENEGIYYYFEHADGKHTMILCDAPTNHEPAPGYKELHFDDPDIKSTDDDYIWDWTSGHEITPNQYALTEYNPLKPTTPQDKFIHVDHSHDAGKYEIFDYPGGYTVPEEGKTYANLRMEEVEAEYSTAGGTSCARGIFAGSTFKLMEHPAFDEEEYLITSINYQLSNDEMGLGSARAASTQYVAHVTCMPSKYEFRTARTTLKPVVQGPQTAKIVGPSGEEIYTDKYSRVKVHFYWDRAGKEDEKASCWMRVSQPVAGKGWGSVNIPRIGQEVIVDFLEGDPDRPIVTGRVYNATQMPPNELPGKKMVSGMKSNSTPGGGGYNEMSMDDTKGKEMITIHGQYDMATTVEHDQTLNVNNNRTTTIKVDDTETVTGKQTISVTGDQAITLKANQKQDITGNQDESIKGNQGLKVTGDQTYDITGAQKHTINGTHDLSAKGASKIVSNAKIDLNAPEITLTGATKITLTAGGSSVEISASGIKITSPAIVDVKGAMIKHNG